MKIKFYIYILIDEQGNRFYKVVHDLCDIIHIGGYKDDGSYRTFDDQARHCLDWATWCGFRLECIEKEIEI